MESLRLECCQFGSDKFYEISIEESTGGYSVSTRFGRNGTKGAAGATTNSLSWYEAYNAAERIASQKKRKGYIEVSQTSGFGPSQPPPARSGSAASTSAPADATPAQQPRDTPATRWTRPCDGVGWF